MTTSDLLREAITTRKAVAATYDGHPRRFCPHKLGRKDGKLHVFVFQYGGTSSSVLPPGGEWRCMEVAGLSGVRIIATDPWRTGQPGHTGRPQSCVDQVLVSIRG